MLHAENKQAIQSGFDLLHDKFRQLTRRLDLWLRVAIHHLIAFYDATFCFLILIKCLKIRLNFFFNCLANWLNIILSY